MYRLCSKLRDNITKIFKNILVPLDCWAMHSTVLRSIDCNQLKDRLQLLWSFVHWITNHCKHSFLINGKSFCFFRYSNTLINQTFHRALTNYQPCLKISPTAKWTAASAAENCKDIPDKKQTVEIELFGLKIPSNGEAKRDKSSNSISFSLEILWKQDSRGQHKRCSLPQGSNL